MIRHGLHKWLHRCVEVPLEGAGILLVYGLLRMLPLTWAAAVGGFLGRTVGPLLPHSKRALENLQQVYPEKSPSEHHRILLDMWDNLGRLSGEYIHLDHIRIDGPAPHLKIHGMEILEALRDDSQPAVLVGAHLAHWEMITLAAAHVHLPLTQVYRAANNPVADWAMRRMQRANGAVLIAKGPTVGRALLKAFRQNQHVLFLNDQKLRSGGVDVPFFGRPALTASAAAGFAVRFQCPLVPIQVIRVGRRSEFEVIVHPPLTLPNSGDPEADIHQLLSEIHQHFESWIQQHPGQWLWLHRRWS